MGRETVELGVRECGEQMILVWIVFAGHGETTTASSGTE
jgi:hypothetical protein